MRCLRCSLLLGLVLGVGCGRSAPFPGARTDGVGGAGANGGGTAGTSVVVAGTDGWVGAGTGGGAGFGVGGASAAGGAGGVIDVTGGTPGTAGAIGGAGSAGQGNAPEGTPVLRLPMNGDSTGSLWATRSLTPAFRWEPVEGAADYEIELDDSCAAFDFHACAFPSPERRERATTAAFSPAEPLAVSTSTLAPVGTRYFWRVRACAGTCGPWSSVRYVDVGRQRQDLDGDGYADLWIERPLTMEGQSVLDVYFGPPPFTRHVELKARGANPNRYDYFGTAAEAVGDVNLDGYSDLAVGCPRPAPEAEVASVFLFLGGLGIASGSSTFFTWDGPVTHGFGSYVAGLGDVNADGASDFAAGGSWTTPQPLSLFLGSPMLTPTRYELQPERDDVALWPIAGGDLNSDGYSDFLAMQTDSLGAQQVKAWLGASTPAQFAQMQSSALAIAAGRAAAILGDVNGDGFAERASFIQEFTGDPPAIDVTWGAPSGDDVETVRFATSIVEDPSIGFSPSVFNAANAGDLNGDGLDETGVAIALHISSLVEVALYFGRDIPQEMPDLLFTVQIDGDRFIAYGAARAAGDLNGDGYDDFVVVPDGDGRAHVFLGGTTPDAIVDHVVGPPLTSP